MNAELDKHLFRCCASAEQYSKIATAARAMQHTMLIAVAVSSIASSTSELPGTFCISAARRAAFCSGVLGPLTLEKCLCNTWRGMLGQMAL